ncbi:MAG TPA: hypothetical protein VKD72_01370 [Gemmataceae bacterium]|nr:hypothetical protein [Gemmataceae bacterium]
MPTASRTTSTFGYHTEDLQAHEEREARLNREAYERIQASARANPNGTTTTAQEKPPKLTGVQTILTYFHEQYAPQYRRGGAVVCKDGSILTRPDAISVPTSALIGHLALATDAPRNQEGYVRHQALPSFFRTWVKVAWGDLLDGLFDEDGLKPDTAALALAAEDFQRIVANALYAEMTLAVRDPKTRERYPERRSAIDWCRRLARIGPWRSVRSKLLWCKRVVLPDGEERVRIALLHGLFTQQHADGRLCDMGPTTFARRARRFGVAATVADNRVHGQRAIILADEFVAELTAASPADEAPTTALPEGVQFDT